MKLLNMEMFVINNVELLDIVNIYITVHILCKVGLLLFLRLVIDNELKGSEVIIRVEMIKVISCDSLSCEKEATFLLKT